MNRDSRGEHFVFQSALRHASEATERAYRSSRLNFAPSVKVIEFSAELREEPVIAF
jgi:hypothetical protein